LRRALGTLIARPKAVDHQHNVAAPRELAGPIALTRLQSAHAVEETAAPVQENHGGMPTIAGRPQQIAVEHRRGLSRAVIVG
jgi:hypothetical protein